MLPFGVTIPATVLQRSEIPEGLINYPVCVTVSNGAFYCHEALANYIHTNRHVITIKNNMKQNLFCLTDTQTINILYVIVLFYVFI